MPPLLHDPEASSLSLYPIALRSFLPSIPNLTRRSASSPSDTLPMRTDHSIQPLDNPLSSLFRRQAAQVNPANPTLIPFTYAGLNAGPPPGEVVGIVFGSVGGFLLILWLIYTCFTMAGGASSVVEEEVVVRRRSRSPRRTVSRSRSRSEVIETRQHSPPRREREREREIRRETVILEETRRAPEREDDIVEVIEEHSPPRRSGGSRRQSGYRTVDPEAFGGGSRPLRKVSRR